MDRESAVRATRKFTRTMGDPEGTALIELMARMVVAAREVVRDDPGRHAVEDLRIALGNLDRSAIKAALDSYIAQDVLVDAYDASTHDAACMCENVCREAKTAAVKT